jgi:hypothetical protein
MDKSLSSLAVSRTIDVENNPNDRELFKKPEELIDFDGPNDPEHPQDWSLFARVWATFMLALFNLVVAIASSIFGSAQAVVAGEFHVSEEVTVLGASLYLVKQSIDRVCQDQVHLSLTYPGIHPWSTDLGFGFREIRTKVSYDSRRYCLWPFHTHACTWEKPYDHFP